LSAKQKKKKLFYNGTGNKKAYQLGVKHLDSAEHFGFAVRLPNGDLRIKKELLLVDFEKNEIIEVPKGACITPVKLESC
jgi:hypothetical protein